MRLPILIFFLSAAGLSFSCRNKNPVMLDSHVPMEITAQYLTVKIDKVNREIHILHESQNRTLLRLDLNDTFAAVRRSEDKVIMKQGSFSMKEAEKERCDLLRLLRMYVEKKEIILHGRLQCGQKTTDVDLKFLPEPERVLMTLRPHDSRFNRIKFRIVAEKNEHVFNPALKADGGDLIGRKITLIADPVTGSQIPVPFFMTTAMRSFDTPQAAYQEWEFNNKELIVEIWDNYLELSIATGDNFRKLLADYARRTGRIAPLPDWAMGNVSTTAGGKEKAEAVLNSAGTAGTPVSAIWLQDLFLNPQGIEAEVDEKLYPDFKNWARALAARGIKVFVTINPFLNSGEKTFHDAKIKHFIVRNRKYEPYQVDMEKSSAYVIDLTNPGARDFVKERLKANLTGLGIYGFVAGFGGTLPWDAALQSTEPASLWHNRYAMEWEKLGGEAIREAGLTGRAEFISAARFTDLAELSALGLSHASLKPYSSAVKKENQLSGIPALRPVYLHYATDPNTYALGGQIMFGADVILAAGATAREKIYLPAGSWIEAAGGKTLEGGQWVNVNSAKPARFIRKGAAMEGLLLAAFK